MGQANSTTNTAGRQVDQETGRGQSSADAAIPDAIQMRPSPQQNNGSRSRRQSIRNSILDFVHAKPSTNTVANTTESGKRWRWRRRQPKQQSTRQAETQVEGRSLSGSQLRDNFGIGRQVGSARDTDTRSVLVSNSSLQEHHDHPDPVAEARSTDPHEVSDSIHAASPNSSKGKERYVEAPDDKIGNSTEALSSVPDRTNSGLDPNTQAGSSASNAAQDSASHAFARAADESLQEAAGSSARIQSSAQPFPPNNPPRRFPPPGTLIVVQGVVRNDSIPLLAQDNPAISSGAETSSIFASAERSVSGAIEQSAASVRTGDGGMETANSSSEGSEDMATLFESLPGSSTASGTEINDVSPRESTSGSSGIDVLGALLSIVSVATAATAASLLSSLNGPLASPVQLESTHTPSNASPSSQEGLGIPSIARALASANPTAAAVLSRRGREREREERERRRMRSIWEGLRDRVTASRGDRNSPGIGTRSVDPATSSTSRTNGSSLVSESLFSELVRAFNLGSLQDERSSDAQSSNSGRESAEEDQEMPSRGQNSRTSDGEELTPGSFEHFLVDLQSDLRLALMRPGPTPDVRRQPDHPEREGPGNPTIHDTASTYVPLAGPSVSPLTQQTESQAARHSGSQNATGASHRLSSLPLASVVEIDRTSDSGNIQPSQGAAAVPDTSSSGNQNSMANSGRVPADAPSTRAGDAPRRGINWWRMYRFPPTMPLQGDSTDLPQSNDPVSSPRSPLAALINNVRPDETPVGGPGMPGDAAQQQSAGALIPVIVVGLQSISSAVQRGPPGPSNPQTEDGAEDNGDSETSRRTGSPLPDYMDNADAPQRAHDTWPSRAARAFSRLGRRDGVADQGHGALNPNSGSRTFLIYVYGGHYPPDHQILSGSDALDTFEAFWELADFLGQVKPPVVTDEEIEQSGLELFKAVNLTEFVNSDRVASNCLDRCLICLDDYNPSDDLRLLTCKHAFHKTCVDRWLKTGRNNCPACRSEGVKT